VDRYVRQGVVTCRRLRKRCADRCTGATTLPPCRVRSRRVCGALERRRTTGTTRARKPPRMSSEAAQVGEGRTCRCHDRASHRPAGVRRRRRGDRRALPRPFVAHDLPAAAPAPSSAPPDALVARRHLRAPGPGAGGLPPRQPGAMGTPGRVPARSRRGVVLPRGAKRAAGRKRHACTWAPSRALRKRSFRYAPSLGGSAKGRGSARTLTA